MSVMREAVRRMFGKADVPGSPAVAPQSVASRLGKSCGFAPALFVKRSTRRALPLRALMTAFAVMILPTTVYAQPKPGKEHEHLTRLTGTWVAESEHGKGTMTYKMGLDGLWLVGDFDGEFGGMKFQGKSLDTYDGATKKYRTVWVDSFSTAPRNMEGDLDKDASIMTMTGEGRGPDGTMVKYKSVTEIKDADTMNFSLFMADKDGKEQPMVKIAYKRKK
jgi:hypothetical protein